MANMEPSFLDALEVAEASGNTPKLASLRLLLAPSCLPNLHHTTGTSEFHSNYVVASQANYVDGFQTLVMKYQRRNSGTSLREVRHSSGTHVV